MKASLWTSCRSRFTYSINISLSKKEARLQLSLAGGCDWAVCLRSSWPRLVQQTLPEPWRAGCWLTSVPGGMQLPDSPQGRIPAWTVEGARACVGGSLVFICWEALGRLPPSLTSASFSADWEQGPYQASCFYIWSLTGRASRAELMCTACCPTWGRGTCLRRLYPASPCPGWALPLESPTWA